MALRAAGTDFLSHTKKETILKEKVPTLTARRVKLLTGRIRVLKYNSASTVVKLLQACVVLFTCACLHSVEPVKQVCVQGRLVCRTVANIRWMIASLPYYMQCL